MRVHMHFCILSVLVPSCACLLSRGPPLLSSAVALTGIPVPSAVPCFGDGIPTCRECVCAFFGPPGQIKHSSACGVGLGIMDNKLESTIYSMLGLYRENGSEHGNY